MQNITHSFSPHYTFTAESSTPTQNVTDENVYDEDEFQLILQKDSSVFIHFEILRCINLELGTPPPSPRNEQVTTSPTPSENEESADLLTTFLKEF